jgi:hypothetical protein
MMQLEDRNKLVREASMVVFRGVAEHSMEALRLSLAAEGCSKDNWWFIDESKEIKTNTATLIRSVGICVEQNKAWTTSSMFPGFPSRGWASMGVRFKPARRGFERCLSAYWELRIRDRNPFAVNEYWHLLSHDKSQNWQV